MKKIVIMLIAVVFVAANAKAQDTGSHWTFNTRAWTTNYFTCALYTLAAEGVTDFLFKGSQKDSIHAERIIPKCDLVFPIGMGKKGFDAVGDIYGPYHRAFGNPIKHIGDYGIGLDASYKRGVVGIYAGAYFKSQEVVFKSDDRNIRAFYFQPRAGLIFGKSQHQFEAGVYYDVVTGCGGDKGGVDRDMLNGGLGLDFAFSSTQKNGKAKTLIEFSMPLHNFFNKNNPATQDFTRKVGYIMLTQRIFL